MSRSHVWHWLPFAMACAACDSAASRDLDKCTAATQRGELGAAIYACRRAASEDPTGASGRDANARLPALQAALERKRAEADKPAPSAKPKRGRSRAFADDDELEGADAPPHEGAIPSCAEICSVANIQCNLIETRAPTPGGHERCNAELDSCMKDCASGKAPP